MFCSVGRLTADFQQRRESVQKRLDFRPLEHEGRDQKRAGGGGHERRVGFDQPLDRLVSRPAHGIGARLGQIDTRAGTRLDIGACAVETGRARAVRPRRRSDPGRFKGFRSHRSSSTASAYGFGGCLERTLT
jgi:hypothetical protein